MRHQSAGEALKTSSIRVRFAEQALDALHERLCIWSFIRNAFSAHKSGYFGATLHYFWLLASTKTRCGCALRVKPFPLLLSLRRAIQPHVSAGIGILRTFSRTCCTLERLLQSAQRAYRCPPRPRFAHV